MTSVRMEHIRSRDRFLYCTHMWGCSFVIKFSRVFGVVMKYWIHDGTIELLHQSVKLRIVCLREQVCHTYNLAYELKDSVRKLGAVVRKELSRWKVYLYITVYRRLRNCACQNTKMRYCSHKLGKITGYYQQKLVFPFYGSEQDCYINRYGLQQQCIWKQFHVSAAPP